MSFVNMYFYFKAFRHLVFSVLCSARRDGECGNNMVFAVLCASDIAEGDGDDGMFSERACHLQISIQSSFPSIACDGCRVSCALHLSQIVFASQIFSPRLELFFRSILYF